MSQRTKELVERFTASNDELVAFVKNCSDADWRKLSTSEEWPICVVARHVAEGHSDLLDMAKTIDDGEELPDFSMDALDLMNAQHAKEHADCSKDEVLDLLGGNGSAITGWISGLNDEDLDHTYNLPVMGGDMNMQQFCEILIGHIDEHVAGIKADTGS